MDDEDGQEGDEEDDLFSNLAAAAMG